MIAQSRPARAGFATGAMQRKQVHSRADEARLQSLAGADALAGLMARQTGEDAVLRFGMTGTRDAR